MSIIIRLEKLPPKDTVAYYHLLFFTLLQQFRTKRRADIQNEMIDGMMKATFEDDERFKNFDFNNYRIGIKDPVLLSMSLLSPNITASIDDLEPNLVLLSGHKRFIVSDNPVVTYNQYFEWMKDVSNTGLVSKGLQLFFPLSPQCLLLLYDPKIYTMLDHQNITHDITESDLLFINILQYINADENIYFDNMSCQSQIETIVQKFRDRKKAHKVKTLKFDKEQTRLSPEKSMMITTFENIPNLHLNLSFMKIKRSAKKVPVRSRLNDRYRKELDLESITGRKPNFAPPPIVPERFVRRKDKN